MIEPSVRVLAIIEAYTVSGPAKNLLAFALRAKTATVGRAAEVSIAAYTRGTMETTAFVATARRNGLEVDVIGERFRFDPRVFAQLKTILAKREPQIVQTHNVKSHFLMALARQNGWLRKDVAWIAWHHGYTSSDFKDRAYNLLNRFSLRFADRVVTVCEAFAADLRAAGIAPGKLVVRHNMIDCAAPVSSAEVAELRQRLGLEDGKTVVLCVGRFSKEKGQIYLIEAATKLKQQHPSLRFSLLLVGDGPERARMEKLCAERGLCARFVGHQTCVTPFYRLADILAVPSLSEGSPNVVLEAMAAGLPIIATNVGGIPEILHDGLDGLLVSPHEPYQMSAALMRLIGNAELRGALGGSAQARARGFSPEVYTRAVSELYVSLLTNH